MNTIIRIIITSTMIIGLSLNMAASNGNETSTAKEIQRHLNISNLNSTFPKNEKIRVEVLFTTQEDGRVNFVMAKTSDAQIKKEVEKSFSKITLKNIKPNVCYGITLNLRAA